MTHRSQAINILAFETSLESCSVALTVGHDDYELHESTPKQRGEFILSLVHALLAKTKFDLSKLDAIAFAKGPGSFTGIRLASSIVQAIAYVHHLPVIAVSTLQTVAQGSYRMRSHEKVISCIDARMKDVYWGTYELNNEGIMINTLADALISPEEVKLPNDLGWVGIGNGWDIYGDILKKRLSNNLVKIEANLLPNAQDVAILAKYYFLHKQYTTAELALPNYLRSENIWKKKL